MKTGKSNNGKVYMAPPGTELGDAGWTEAGYIAEDGITLNAPVQNEDGSFTYSGTVNHPIPAGTSAETMRKYIAEKLGLTLDPWQEHILNNLYPGTIYGDNEREYLKDRLNARLRGEHPGPWEKDRFKR